MSETGIASIALIVRSDGKILLVEHKMGPFDGEWTLPVLQVPAHLTAEETLEAIFSETLSVDVTQYEFFDTLYLNDKTGDRLVGNIFTCNDWSGEIQFDKARYSDAGWVTPGDEPREIQLNESIRAWINGAIMDSCEDMGTRAHSVDSMIREMATSRSALLDAFNDLPVHVRYESESAENLSPVQKLICLADQEYYLLSQFTKLLSGSEAIWRPFNENQWRDMRDFSEVVGTRENDLSVLNTLADIRNKVETLLSDHEETISTVWAVGMTGIPINLFDLLGEFILSEKKIATSFKIFNSQSELTQHTTSEHNRKG
jgi:ADP-ribose pyrophosphatase YjhB (NUDIX family)|tara:strand:+ start:4104 stop:5048 length:945 start_codon:yes stop_codon:yes gene_type:complete